MATFRGQAGYWPDGPSSVPDWGRYRDSPASELSSVPPLCVHVHVSVSVLVRQIGSKALQTKAVSIMSTGVLPNTGVT